MDQALIPASVLATRALVKAFGSLVVANDVSLDLPAGARYALIGPNGAGKTTLINLITGTLRPDRGEVLLAGDVVTRLAPHARVKRGLARTFQINSLFPDLCPLEAVTLAVCERLGRAGEWRRSLVGHADAVDEAFKILCDLGLEEVCARPTRALAYGQQRLLEIALALATRPNVLLLDEPAAGVPKGESAALFEAISALPAKIAVLFIEHDMDLVFRFASHIIVMAGGAVLAEGNPEVIAANPEVKQVYLGEAFND